MVFDCDLAFVTASTPIHHRMMKDFIGRLTREDIWWRFGSARSLATVEDMDREFPVRPPLREMLRATGSDGAIAGIATCAAIEPGIVEVALLVRSDLKFRTIGRQLLEGIQSRARADGLRSLMATIHFGNHPARALCRSAGFRCIGLADTYLEVEWRP